MDLTKYENRFIGNQKTNKPTFRFQDLILTAIKDFGIKKPFDGMLWGVIGRNKKINESFTIHQLERAINETKSRKLDNPGAYFIKLIKIFLK